MPARSLRAVGKRAKGAVRPAVLLLAALLLVRSAPRPAYPGPRAGVVAVRWPSSQALDQLGMVWYYTYSSEGPADPRHHRVWMVLPHYDEARLRRALRQHPGTWWIVGNEPNDPYQDNLSPEAYAAFYHRVDRFVRQVDPTARLISAGIANADWQWAEAFCSAYRLAYGRYPRVDAWNVHNYVLEPATSQLDREVMTDRLVAFRQWMDRAGEGHKPLVLGEFGVLMGLDRHDPRHEPPEAIAAFLRDTVAWLYATDDVQAWAWFANDTAGLFNGDLFDAEESLTLYGQAYRDAIQAGLAGTGDAGDAP
jgi:hypothetical protein